jgi:hypothetical protein
MDTWTNCIIDPINVLKSNQVQAVFNELGLYVVHNNEIYAFAGMEPIKYFTASTFMT